MSNGPYKIGQRFGPCRLEEYLGAGAFKSVYRACNEGKTVPAGVVALGFPHQQDPEGIAEIEREFALTSRFVHSGIVRVYALERHEGVAFLVMEYLEGTSLRAILRERGHLPAEEAVRYTGVLSEALAYAHAGHVLHRDVKPENIFITKQNNAKLLDFGVARALARTSEKASTRIGTMEYMAPELFQGAAGTNADLWGLGITLYEMLTGMRPFRGEVGELIQKILEAKYDEAPLRDRGVDNRIVRVLRKLLRKDPESRYQAAEELSRDLETAARRTRVVDDDESRLDVLVRASTPIIGVFSHEEDRVVGAVRSIARRLSEDRGKPRPLYIWSASRGLRDDKDSIVGANILENPTEGLLHVVDNPEDAIYLFLDMHHHFTPISTRLIRDAARAVRRTRKSLLLVSPVFSLPDELRNEVTLSMFHLPDREQFDPLLDNAVKECKEAGMSAELSDDSRASILRAASGLSLREAERTLRRAAFRLGGLTDGVAQLIAEEKTQVIRKTGILEYYHSQESFQDVGGLEALLDWFKARAAVFAGTARYAGLPVPRGVLLVGVPGCGKSLSARALAGAWRVPLLRLDVARIFGSIVGASEANLRLAIQTAEAVSPCILWIDEVEKGFAGVQSQSGGGVAQRVFGAFLSWLQDKRSPVFVVATANDLSGIPPEFLRQGRFDEIFFAGLPNARQREAILRIHLGKRRRDAKKFEIDNLARLSEGFSGAEIEQAVVAGLFHAFDAGREIETKDIADAIGETYPLSRARGREVGALIHWAENHARSASYADAAPRI
jgi:serine/threonine protein kinase/MoxR-like ATPase